MQNFEYAATSETDKRQREIKLLINIMQPDPEYQPLFVSDKAYVYDITEANEAAIRKRLIAYFEESYNFPFDKPLWQAVDDIKWHFPRWPEELNPRIM